MNLGPGMYCRLDVLFFNVLTHACSLPERLPQDGGGKQISMMHTLIFVFPIIVG